VPGIDSFNSPDYAGPVMGVSLRICSLLPSATEIVFELGLSDRLVAVTHECDYPPEATRLPVIRLAS